MLAPCRCRLLLLCGIGVWRYLQITIEIQLHLFCVQTKRIMCNTSLDTNNNPKTRMERFKEFCSLPGSRIAELPLSLFEPLNKWFGMAFTWLFDNPVTQWMAEIKDHHPKTFWISSVFGIPIAVVFYFYMIDLWLIGVFCSVVIVICLAIILAVICKICHMFFVITSNRK